MVFQLYIIIPICNKSDTDLETSLLNLSQYVLIAITVSVENTACAMGSVYSYVYSVMSVY